MIVRVIALQLLMLAIHVVVELILFLIAAKKGKYLIALELVVEMLWQIVLVIAMVPL